MIVNVDVSKSGTNYTFDVNLTDVSDECILVTALYKNMKISEVKTTSLSANTSEKSVVMSADEADFAKVFIWNSLKKIKPLCKSVTAVIR